MKTRVSPRSFATDCSFHVKWRTTGKVQFLFFRFLPVLTKFSFLEEDWPLGNNSMNFRDFPDISFLFLLFFVNFFFLFPYVHEIQYNQNIKTHTCSLLSTMRKYMHTSMGPIYTDANASAVVICVHIYIYVHVSIRPSFPPSLSSYKLNFFCLFLIKF